MNGYLLCLNIESEYYSFFYHKKEKKTKTGQKFMKTHAKLMEF